VSNRGSNKKNVLEPVMVASSYRRQLPSRTINPLRQPEITLNLRIIK